MNIKLEHEYNYNCENDSDFGRACAVSRHVALSVLFAGVTIGGFGTIVGGIYSTPEPVILLSVITATVFSMIAAGYAGAKFSINSFNDENSRFYPTAVADLTSRL